MSGCGGNCGSCSGCGRELVLTEKEIAFVELLGQVAFLPVERAMGDAAPIYPEDDSEEMGLLLQCLEKKGLISLDYDKPLKGFAYTRQIGGSMALTERGQKVLELMEYQGVRQPS